MPRILRAGASAVHRGQCGGSIRLGHHHFSQAALLLVGYAMTGIGIGIGDWLLGRAIASRTRRGSAGASALAMRAAVP